FRSFSMLFLRSSITGVGTTYTKVNFSMSIYIINEIYTLFFNEDGELKNEVIDDGEYICPLTKKKYKKNLRSMLKNAIRTKLEQILNSVDETVLANDSSR
ncbi:hypothetical protein ABEV41_01435, partial [Geobacillus thermodenitrificans]